MSAVSTSRKNIPKDQFLNRKIPENPRYKDVKSVIDTGAAAKYKGLPNRLKDSQKNPQDLFKRIKLSTFVSLMVEVGKEEINLANRPLPQNTDQSAQKLPQKEYLSSFHSLINGISELDLKTEKELRNEPLNKLPVIPQHLTTSPYLLLDVRDDDAYKACHIITAKHYPSNMLCRTCNYETNDLLLYKNVPMCIIVLYDEDETIASRVAVTLTQRGYDNIFVLSGGLKLAATKFESGLLIGRWPDKCRPATASSAMAIRNGHHESKLTQPTTDLQTDLKLKKKMAENQFSLNDLEMLQRQLDHCVTTMTSAPSNSRYCQSRASTARTVSSTMFSRANTARTRAWR